MEIFLRIFIFFEMSKKQLGIITASQSKFTCSKSTIETSEECVKSIQSYQIIVSFLCLYHCVKSVQMRSFFYSVFPCIRTEYGDLWSRSPYSVRIQEITDQTKLRIWTVFMPFVVNGTGN